MATYQAGDMFESRSRPTIILQVLRVNAKGSVQVLEAQWRPGHRAPSVAQKSYPALALDRLYRPVDCTNIDPAITAALAGR